MALIAAAISVAVVYGLIRESTWAFVNLAIGGVLLAVLMTVGRR